ncbi:hypothetical protein HKK52_00010 [Pseudomonas sp. ADAK2]|uniref:DUF7716 domain-containing protein n=1 Tax=unclassified Pseudomonas TaxID=196821 RepID=UPI001463E5A1|nr:MULTISPECIES: hypothetical protein [unclassified Pseudomonas]QJI39391.1 hypothetical protein HKK53_00010 [Pseudomonas sp. ADAK7]QJI45697.1 hypothetical protein HKK52_00010 [Pseudomonas sp. ADAK2]
MIRYKNLNSLLAEVDDLDKFGTLYSSKSGWAEDPSNTEILLLLGDDELEDLDERGNPVLANKYGASYFFDVEIFQSVIDLQRKNNSKSNANDYIRAINYYLENDDFYEVT